MSALPLKILCEDGPLFAVNKPAGLPTQGVTADVESLESQVKAYIRQEYGKPGNVYLGVPHRLDRPVSGVVIFARNSKAAARLAEQFRLRQVRKWYLAVTEGTPDSPAGSLSDWLVKVPDRAEAQVAAPETPGGKLATLRYRVLQSAGTNSLVLVEPETGRMHQIRVQFASRGWPIVGDQRYGSQQPFPGLERAGEPSSVIALHAARLDVLHPIRYDRVSLHAPLPETWSAFGFDPPAFDDFSE